MGKAKYRTLVDYMERTGTSSTRLLKLVKDRERVTISPSLFSMILRGSRRCSILNAWALHCVTGVPMDELRRWPRYAKQENSQSAA
jgi:hypothetical protein